MALKKALMVRFYGSTQPELDFCTSNSIFDALNKAEGNADSFGRAPLSVNVVNSATTQSGKMERPYEHLGAGIFARLGRS
jgi:hypothetical protein